MSWTNLHENMICRKKNIMIPQKIPQQSIYMYRYIQRWYLHCLKSCNAAGQDTGSLVPSQTTFFGRNNTLGKKLLFLQTWNKKIQYNSHGLISDYIIRLLRIISENRFNPQIKIDKIVNAGRQAIVLVCKNMRYNVHLNNDVQVEVNVNNVTGVGSRYNNFRNTKQTWIYSYLKMF